MSLEEEKAFLTPWIEKAVTGGVLGSTSNPHCISRKGGRKVQSRQYTECWHATVGAGDGRIPDIPRLIRQRRTNLKKNPGIIAER